MKGGRAVPIDFLDYAFNIRKRTSVLEVWKAVESNDSINLRLCLRENLRVQYHGQ